MTPKEEKFMELIHSTFDECYKIFLGPVPDMDRIERLLNRRLEMDLAIKNESLAIAQMKRTVADCFDDPSTYDTGVCSALFMNAINKFTQEDQFTQEVQGLSSIVYEEV